jgi:hypothetical protein
MQIVIHSVAVAVWVVSLSCDYFNIIALELSNVFNEITKQTTIVSKT